jgi:hypothetical protein
MDPAITSWGWCRWSLILERAQSNAQVMQAHCSHGFKYCEGLFLGTPGMRRCRKHCEKIKCYVNIIQMQRELLSLTIKNMAVKTETDAWPEGKDLIESLTL